MTEIVSEIILSIDGAARGLKSPAYYGYGGAEFFGWLAQKNAQPHRTLIGCKTFDALSNVPEGYQDENFRRMTENEGWVVSSTLKEVSWPGLTVLGSGFLDAIRIEREGAGAEIRIMGSLSIVRQLLAANLLDRLRLIYCPLILPQSGIEPFFAGMPDQKLEMIEHRVLDGKVLVLDYRPDGLPPYSGRD
jgi:dihydrofolate reductase